MNIRVTTRVLQLVTPVTIGLLSISLLNLAWAQPKNKAPRFTQYPVIINVELGDKVSSLYVATDPDKDSLTFSPVGSQLPGATLKDVKEGAARLEWTPTREGTFEIAVTVFDDGTPSKSVTVTTKIRVVKKSQGSVDVQASPAPATAAVGDRVEHELVVKNNSSQMLDTIVLTSSYSSGAGFVRAHELDCDVEQKTATCTVGTLAPAGSDGDTKVITLVSQMNVAAQQTVTSTVGTESDDLPLSGNVQNVWTTDVMPISTDKIQLSLFGSNSISVNIPLTDVNIAVAAQYAVTNTNAPTETIELSTYNTFGTTNLNGDVSLSLPDLNFDRISTTVTLTESVNSFLPSIDFELGLNNMPPTGELTTTVSGVDALAACSGIQLWTVDGKGQTSDCASQSGHSWQNVVDASHATITGKVIRPQQLKAADHRAARANPIHITIEIVALPDHQLYLPLFAK